MISFDQFGISDLSSDLCTLPPSEPLTFLGYSFRLPEPDLRNFGSVSFGFSLGILFLYSHSVVILGITRKDALI